MKMTDYLKAIKINENQNQKSIKNTNNQEHEIIKRNHL